MGWSFSIIEIDLIKALKRLDYTLFLPIRKQSDFGALAFPKLHEKCLPHHVTKGMA